MSFLLVTRLLNSLICLFLSPCKAGGIARSRESVQNAYQVFLKSRKLNSRACLFCLLFPRYNKWKMTE